MATIRDVAEKAGVSVTSVSHVVNESRFVTPGLKTKILNAMKELDYRPNIVAQSLRRKRSFTLGLIIPDIVNPYFAEIARHVEDASFDHGYSLIICNSDQDFSMESRYAQVLADKQVDGAILVSAGTNPAKSVAPALSIPFIMLDRELPNLHRPTDSIQSDNLKGGYLVASHLLSLEHRDFACITGLQNIHPSCRRLEGFRKALEEADLHLDDERILQGDFRPESGYRCALAIMQWRPRPTAIFAFNDLMAFGAITALYEKGIRVPEDISVVGYDNIEQSSYFAPRLTTVAQPHHEMGRMAVEKLLERIANKNLADRVFHISPRLVLRSSTAFAKQKGQRGDCS
jgi:LacI family transcriptional regulator